MAKIKQTQTNVYYMQGQLKAYIVVCIDDLDIKQAKDKSFLDDEKRKFLEQAMSDALDKWEFEYQ